MDIGVLKSPLVGGVLIATVAATTGVNQVVTVVLTQDSCAVVEERAARYERQVVELAARLEALEAATPAGPATLEKERAAARGVAEALEGRRAESYGIWGGQAVEGSEEERE